MDSRAISHQLSQGMSRCIKRGNPFVSNWFPVSLLVGFPVLGIWGEFLLEVSWNRASIDIKNSSLGP